MGAIKDLADLVGVLIEKNKDRKFAAELRELQRMINGLFSEHAELHESRIALMTENDKLNKKIPELEARVLKLEQEKAELLDPPNTEPPTEEQISIMREMINPYDGVFLGNICKKLNMSLPIIDYQAGLLRTAGYLHVSMEHGVPQYSLSPKGRTFLFEKNMLAPPFPC